MLENVNIDFRISFGVLLNGIYQGIKFLSHLFDISLKGSIMFGWLIQLICGFRAKSLNCRHIMTHLKSFSVWRTFALDSLVFLFLTIAKKLLNQTCVVVLWVSSIWWLVTYFSTKLAFLDFNKFRSHEKHLWLPTIKVLRLYLSVTKVRNIIDVKIVLVIIW